MTVKQRVFTIKVMEKVKQDPEYAKRMGIMVIYSKGKKKEDHK